ncbi:hypothetical protein CCACVL1_04719 [Corchorus capsularis]|uniref:Uncharacterized protein n=1 Tax=Corchorus capsularis TaxID=210143 RepID=A0A1R3JQ90_COCAP|nr:hypothetical protein CCACVL1_04719 [Corchorus capsularis]
MTERREPRFEGDGKGRKRESNTEWESVRHHRLGPPPFNPFPDVRYGEDLDGFQATDSTMD